MKQSRPDPPKGRIAPIDIRPMGATTDIPARGGGSRANL
jgi:hypothetical protein